jgi:hypothetical protein
MRYDERELANDPCLESRGHEFIGVSLACDWSAGGLGIRMDTASPVSEFKIWRLSLRTTEHQDLSDSNNTGHPASHPPILIKFGWIDGE